LSGVIVADSISARIIIVVEVEDLGALDLGI